VSVQEFHRDAGKSVHYCSLFRSRQMIVPPRLEFVNSWRMRWFGGIPALVHDGLMLKRGSLGWFAETPVGGKEFLQPPFLFGCAYSGHASTIICDPDIASIERHHIGPQSNWVVPHGTRCLLCQKAGSLLTVLLPVPTTQMLLPSKATPWRFTPPTE
jgi:hypothetical protein